MMKFTFTRDDYRLSLLVNILNHKMSNEFHYNNKSKGQATLLVPKRLSTRLVLLFTLLLMSAMLIFTVHGIYEQTEHFENNMKQQARGLAQNLAATSAESLLSRDYSSIELSLTRASRFPGILELSVTDTRGKLLGDIVKGKDGKPEVRYGLPSLKTPEKIAENIRFFENKMTIWQPMILGELLGWIKITYSSDAIKDELKDIWIENTLVGILVLIVTGVLLNYFLQTPLRAIQHYTNFAVRLDEDMGKQTEIYGSSTELSNLGTSLNNVSIRLKEQSDSISAGMQELERVAALVEYAPNIILSLNSLGKVQYINPFGEKLLSTKDCSVSDINHILPPNIDLITDIVIEKQLPIIDLSGDYKDMSFVWTIAPVPGQETVHAYGTDVSTHKMAEQTARSALVEKLSAESANKSKSQFLANMSHELRTPLNAIIGYSEIIEEDLIDADKTEILTDVHKVHGAAHHLLTLIDEILDLSKIEAGRMELFYEAFNLTKLVKEVVETTKPLAKNNNNSLSVNLGSKQIHTYTDLIKIRQILFNLISNASKFSNNGTIEVKLCDEMKDHNHWISFHVKDTGIGMSQDQIDQVFEPFSQADNSTTRKYGGTGLGLAITKRYCEMLGGSIEVDSQPDFGSTFSVHIPVQPFCSLKAHA